MQAEPVNCFVPLYTLKHRLRNTEVLVDYHVHLRDPLLGVALWRYTGSRLVGRAEIVRKDQCTHGAQV